MSHDVRNRLTQFYLRHNPEKVKDVDQILLSFEGREDAMFEHLRAKYGAGPENDDSSPRPRINSSGVAFRPKTTTPQVTFSPDVHSEVEVSIEPIVEQEPSEGRSRKNAVIENAVDEYYIRPRSSTLMGDSAPSLRSLMTDLQTQMKNISDFDPLVRVRDDNAPEAEEEDPEFESVPLTEFITAVTQFQHVAQSFCQHAAHLVEYSETQRQSEQSGTVAAAQLDNAHHSPVRYLVSQQSDHYRYKWSGDERKAVLYPTTWKRDVLRTATNKFPSSNDQVGYTSSQVISERVVIDVIPLGNERNVIAETVLQRCKPGDMIVLHPGTYFENMLFEAGVDVELRPAIEGDEGSVTIVQGDPSLPVLNLKQDAAVRISGVSIQETNVPTIPSRTKGSTTSSKKRSQRIDSGKPHSTVPLITCSQSSRLDCRSIAVLGGTGGATIMGNANGSFSHCTFRRASFAGVFCKDKGFVTLTNSYFINCEVGIRVREATFSIQQCELRYCATDGIVLHGSARGVVERTSITQGGDNGIILSPTCEILLTRCVIAENKMWGIYVPSGADFALVTCDINDNGLGDSSRPPPTVAGATRTYLE